jgi:hypothetical protein
MIIHQPEIIQQDEYSIVWARMEMAKGDVDLPEILWYRVPNRFAEFLTLQSDAFLVPGLLAGMFFGEDIEVRGVVSPRLAYNIEEYKFLVHFNNPDDMKPVGIKYNQLKPLNAEPKAVGTTFSGGVDSLFTVWQHLPQNQAIPGYQITHGLIIKGFNLVDRDKHIFDQRVDRYENALMEHNIQLVPIETNAVGIILPRMSFRKYYGPVLIGSALSLGKLFKRFYIPSSNDYWQLKIRVSSTSPLNDKFLSSDTLELIHHGAMYRRVEKTKMISGWKVAQENLTICSYAVMDGHLKNCSRCEKCVRTMLPIYALGRMDDFVTFLKPLKNNREGLWWARKFDPSKSYFTKEVFRFAKVHNKRLVFWIRAGVVLGYVRSWILNLIPGFVKQWFQRYGHFVDPLKEKDVFEDLDVIRTIQSKNLELD